MYCAIQDNDDREHLLKLIEWIYSEVCRAGGDGDALWYSKFYDVKELFELIKEFNDKQKFPWGLKLEGITIYWGENQEGAIITNDKNLFDTASSWIQAKIIN